MKKNLGLLTCATLASTMFVTGTASAAALNISTANQTAGTVLDVGNNTPLTFSGAGSVIVSGATHALSATTNASITATISNTTADTEVLASGSGSAFVIPGTYNTAGQSVALIIGNSAKVTGGADAYFIDSGTTVDGAISLDNSGTLTSTTGHAIKIAPGTSRANAHTFTNQTSGTIVATTPGKAGLDSQVTAGFAAVTLNNRGTITADRGIHINHTNGAAFGSFTVLNTGTINAGALEAVKYATGSTTSHTITNFGTMTTATGAAAVSLNAGMTGAGKLSNSGTITSTVDGSVGVLVPAGGATPLLENLAGGVIQSLGTTATSYGLNAGATVFVLNNAGTIRSVGGTAIKASANAITTFNNSGNITKGSAGGAVAIDMSAQTSAVTFSNTAGTVTGDIKLTNQADTFNLSGGSIVGDLDGTLGAAIKTLNLSGGTFTGNISLLAAVNPLNVNGSFITGGTILNGRALTLNNAGTTFTVNHAVTGVENTIGISAGTKLKINEAGSVVAAGNPVLTQNAAGILSFQLGKGVDTANTGAAPGTINTNGFIGSNAMAFAGAPTTRFEISQSGSGYIGNNAKFYVIRSTAVTTGSSVSLETTSTANTALLSFAPSHDGTGLFFTATRTAPAAVNFTKVNSLTEKAARPVLVEIDRIGLLNVAANNAALNPTFGGIQAITSASAMADEAARLAPQVNGSATRAATVASQGVIGNTTSQRLASLRDDLAGARRVYSAGSERDGMKTYGLWGQFVGNKGIQKTRDGVIGFDSKTFGFALGGDKLVTSNLVLGVSGGYVQTDVDSKHVVRDRTDINTFSAIVYGSYGLNAHWYIDGSANYSAHRYTGRRNITVPGAGSVAFSKYSGTQYGMRATAGYHYNHKEWQITPMAGVRLSNLNLDTYTETGTATTPVLTVDSKNVPETMLSGGARFKLNHEVRGGRVLPEIHGMLNYDLSAKAHRAGSQFMVAGAPVGNVFLSEGAKEPKFSWNAGAGLTVSTSKQWHTTLQYDYTGKSQYSAHAGMLNLRYTW